MPDDRCWICFEGESQDAGPWRHICKCNLTAHERCLLQWARQAENRAECPQCHAPVKVDRPRSLMLECRNKVIKVAWVILLDGVLATAAHGLFGFGYSVLYEVGANTIRLMCTRDEAFEALGDVSLATYFMQAAPFPVTPLPVLESTFRDPRVYYQHLHKALTPSSVRRAIAVPLVPIGMSCLISRSFTSDLMLLLMPLSMWMGKEHAQRYRQSFVWLLVARKVHHLFLDYVVHPLMRRMLLVARPELNHAQEPPRRPPVLGRIDLRFDVNVNANPENPEAVEEFERLIDRALPVMQEQEPPEAEAEDEPPHNPLWIRYLFSFLAQPREEHVVNPSVELLGRPSQLFAWGYPVLIPYACRALGSTLCYFGMLRSLSMLNRNLVAFGLLVGMRDCVNLWCGYLSARQQSPEGQRVIEHSEV